MVAQADAASAEVQARCAALELENAKLKRINAALLERVESIHSRGDDAYADYFAYALHLDGDKSRRNPNYVHALYGDMRAEYCIERIYEQCSINKIQPDEEWAKKIKKSCCIDGARQK